MVVNKLKLSATCTMFQDMHMPSREVVLLSEVTDDVAEATVSVCKMVLAEIL